MPDENNTVDPSLSELYTYDGLNRVTSFEQGTLNDTDTAIEGTPSTSQSWTYDALGNQLSVTTNGTEVDNTFNDQNQMSGNSYDKNGNMISDASGNTYVYNPWNQLVAVNNSSDETIAAYTYDANGNRISQTEGGTTTNLYLSSLGQVIEEDQGSTVTAQNVWNINYVNDLLQRTQGTTTYYMQHDANFNVTAVTDTSGNVLERYTYDPYGAVTVRNADGTVKGDGTLASSSIGSPYLFQGGRIDPVTGLYQFGTREYNLSLGRWLQQDPLTYINGANTYQFVMSNPANSMDPFGLLQIHIWFPMPGEEGHASITLDDGTHISWWPIDPNANGLTSCPANPNQTLLDDIGGEGRLPDRNINLKKLDEAAIENWWNNYKNYPQNDWSFGNNCSQIAMDALLAGKPNWYDRARMEDNMWPLSPGVIWQTGLLLQTTEQNGHGWMYKLGSIVLSL